MEHSNHSGGTSRGRVWLDRALLVGMVVFTTACGAPEPSHSIEHRILVGVLPDRSPAELRERYAPLVRHLAASSQLELELAVPESYDELLEWFHEDRIQLAWFGGLTFLRAERQSGARALAMRDVDLRFTTDFLIASTGTERSLRELAGATFSFGPSLSTSGHLMPRFHLHREGIDPEAFFEGVRHSDGHDQTALWVQDGLVDVGAVNSVVVDAMLRDGRLSADRVRVLGSTAPYRNYVWAVQADISATTHDALLNAFLELDENVSEHAAILARLSARGFVPSSNSDYQELRDAATMFGLW